MRHNYSVVKFNRQYGLSKRAAVEWLINGVSLTGSKRKHDSSYGVEPPLLLDRTHCSNTRSFLICYIRRQ